MTLRFGRPETQADLDAAAIRDLLIDAHTSEQQAEHGPFYPHRGITAESLRAYAAKCRARAARYASGGAHRAAIDGSP